MNYISTFNNKVLIKNEQINPDGFSSILLRNTGTDSLTINDNIILAPGEALSFENKPYVVIDQIINVRFAGVALMVKQCLIIRTYFKEVKEYANNSK